MIRAYSQCDQDLVVLGIFAKNKLSKGRYIDIGAHDGVSLSNTKIFEEIGWDGVCIEPNPDVFKLLMKNRRSINLNVAISDKNGTADFIKINGKSEMLSGIADFMSESHEKRIKSENSQNGGDSEKIVVKTRNIMGIIDEYFTDRHIDFMSIDVEGGEFKILKSIDFEKYVIDLLVVEKNYDESIVYEFMMSQGYYCIPLEQDDLFIRRG